LALPQRGMPYARAPLFSLNATPVRRPRARRLAQPGPPPRRPGLR